jgi:DNA-binding NarL/FixJ family response regulator
MSEEGNKLTTMIRVIVVDDQQLIREGIASLLDLQDSIQVVATVANGKEAVERTLDLLPDVVLMDVRMPVMDGVQATALINGKLPDCKILMLTTFDDEEYIVQALKAGAKGYLLKDIPPGDLAQAIRLVYAGIYQLDATAASKLIGAMAGLTATRPVCASDAPAPHDLLTAREVEVLRYIALGATNREIAVQLVVSEGTIKNHISNILTRLGLRDRIQAALYAHEHHLL